MNRAAKLSGARGAVRTNGARDVILLLIATPASSTGYDSTSPYMEQNETKRGAH